MQRTSAGTVKSNQTNHIIVRHKVDQRADQLNLPQVINNKNQTKKQKLKYKTDEQKKSGIRSGTVR